MVYYYLIGFFPFGSDIYEIYLIQVFIGNKLYNWITFFSSLYYRQPLFQRERVFRLDV